MKPIITKQELNHRRKINKTIDITNIKNCSIKKQEKKENKEIKKETNEITMIKSLIQNKNDEEKKPKKKFTHQDIKNELKMIQHQHSQMIFNSNVLLSSHKIVWKDELHLLDKMNDLNDK